MKKLITSVLLLFCLSVMVSQTVTEDDYFSKPAIISKDRVSTSITMGAGLSFLNTSKSTLYTTFVAPKIGYQITSKFKLDIGLMHYTASGNTFMQLNPNESILNTGNGTVSGNLVFVDGSYQLNPKLVMSGAVMMDANNRYNKQSDFKLVTMGVDYKVSERTLIGFRASVSQGNSNYYINQRTGNYNYNANSLDPMGSFLSPITQWGMERSMSPMIR